MSNFFFYFTIFLFILLSLILILLVLIQKGRGGGLSGAFGGGGGGNTAFGAKTGDVLTWATSVVFGIFLLLAIILNLLANSRHAAAQAKLKADAPVQTLPASSGGMDPGTSGIPLERPLTQP